MWAAHSRAHVQTNSGRRLRGRGSRTLGSAPHENVRLETSLDRHRGSAVPNPGTQRCVAVIADSTTLGLFGTPAGAILTAETAVRISAGSNERSTVKHQLSIGRAAASGSWESAWPSPVRLRNSPSEIGVATLSIRVNNRNPTAKIPAATRNSVMVG